MRSQTPPGQRGRREGGRQENERVREENCDGAREKVLELGGKDGHMHTI